MLSDDQLRELLIDRLTDSPENCPYCIVGNTSILSMRGNREARACGYCGKTYIVVYGVLDIELCGE